LKVKALSILSLKEVLKTAVDILKAQYYDKEAANSNKILDSSI